MKNKIIILQDPTDFKQKPIYLVGYRTELCAMLFHSFLVDCSS